jgi:hypothetical protein
MKQFETRVEYMEAIARAMGLPGMEDLSYEHRNVLQVEHFARLAPILDMVEAAAEQPEPLPFAEEDGALVDRLVAIDHVLIKHRDSKVRAVQALVAEIDAILDGEEEEDAGVPQP